MRITFSKNSWEDYTSWLTKDKSMLKKINELIREIQRTPFEGKGKPEPLKYDLAGFWLLPQRIPVDVITNVTSSIMTLKFKQQCRPILY